MMSDYGASFINAMKDPAGESTTSQMMSMVVMMTAKARQDVVYNELWTNGGSVIPRTYAGCL